MESRIERAKQFMPFDALSGLREELKKRERNVLKIEKIEISEERQVEISTQLMKIEKGVSVTCTHFKNGYYISSIGKVAAVSFVYKYIKIENEKIFFDDIYDIKVYRK